MRPQRHETTLSLTLDQHYVSRDTFVTVGQVGVELAECQHTMCPSCPALSTLFRCGCGEVFGESASRDTSVTVGQLRYSLWGHHVGSIGWAVYSLVV